MSDFEIDNATPEQLVLVAQIYVEFARMGPGKAASLYPTLVSAAKRRSTWSQSDPNKPAVIEAASLKEAVKLAKEHASVPGPDKGGETIPWSNINKDSRPTDPGIRQKFPNAGERSTWSKSKVEIHDPHQNLVGPDQPAHHEQRHVHSVNNKGKEKIFVVKDPASSATLQSLKNVAFSASLGVGVTAAVNINLLLNGEFARYASQIGTGALTSGISAGASEGVRKLAPRLGEKAGPVAGVLVSTVFSTYHLSQTGDWSRFAKDFGGTTISTVTGYGGAQAGAAIGVVFGPPGVVVGGLVGGLAGCLFGGWITNISPLGGPTELELDMVKAKHTALWNTMAELEAKGYVLPKGTTPTQFEQMLNSGKLEVKLGWRWAAVASNSGAGTELLKKAAFREAVRMVFLWAKALSPDLTTGLKILLSEVRAW